MSEFTVTCYFSFRSPYAWLALERWQAILGEFPIQRNLVPIYPRPGEFPNDPGALPAKVEYIVQDLLRLTNAYDLPFLPPAGIDTDWANSHAAFLAAAEAGHGDAFALLLCRARWCEQKDVGLDEVIAEKAAACGLDPQHIVAGAHSAALRSQVEANIDAASAAGVFGVPTFFFQEQMFWGHDRMDFLAAALRTSLDQAG